MKLRKVKYGDRTLFEVDTGIMEGRRRRLFFKTRTAAELRYAQLKADRKSIGRRWADLPARERREVSEVIAEVQAARLTIRQVWDAYKEGKRVILNKDGKRFAGIFHLPKVKRLRCRSYGERRPAVRTTLAHARQRGARLIRCWCHENAVARYQS